MGPHIHFLCKDAVVRCKATERRMSALSQNQTITQSRLLPLFIRKQHSDAFSCFVKQGRFLSSSRRLAGVGS
jgi:hypothetical protein